MLSPETIQQYQRESVARAGYCAHCINRKLEDGQIYICKECEDKLFDPNGLMKEDENG